MLKIVLQTREVENSHHTTIRTNADYLTEPRNFAFIATFMRQPTYASRHTIEPTTKKPSFIGIKRKMLIMFRASCNGVCSGYMLE
jgi:hypothetical protein